VWRGRAQQGPECAELVCARISARTAGAARHRRDCAENGGSGRDGDAALTAGEPIRLLRRLNVVTLVLLMAGFVSVGWLILAVPHLARWLGFVDHRTTLVEEVTDVASVRDDL